MKTTYKAISNYRMPRENGQASVILSMVWDGQTAIMSGGKWGSHTIQTTDRKAVAAHWNGYVSNNRGRQTKPRIEYREVR